MKDSLILSDDYCFRAVQGEGPFMGHLAVFLRLAMCNLTCIGYKSEGAPFGCDTHAQWNKPHKMSFDELNTYFEMEDLVSFLKNGARLIITGGEPMLQAKALGEWLTQFIDKYDLSNLNIDFETNGTISPATFMSSFNRDHFIGTVNFVCCPKLSTNGDPKEKRYKPDVLSWLNDYNFDKYDDGIAAFKFVVNTEDDIKEVFVNYIDAGIISKEFCWLMPTAGSREELIERAPKVIEWCIQYGFKYSNRTHIMAFDRKLRV